RAAHRRRIARRPPGAAAARRPGSAGSAPAGARRLWRADADQEGRLRHRPGPPEPPSGDRPEVRRPLCRRRLVGQSRVEPEPKATIQRFDADCSNQTTVTSGTRHPTALAFHPETGELWALVQERDGRPKFATSSTGRSTHNGTARKGSEHGQEPHHRWSGRRHLPQHRWTLSSPGTSGSGTNPEQLFAAGWSACFISAIKLVAGKLKVAVPVD